MTLKLIYARAANGVIGNKNQLPWHLPEDLKRFKRLTSGHAVIMGRKTWESLPANARPLPGRTNIVVTRQTGYAAAGAVTASSLERALAAVPPGKDAWVIGGGELYAQALPLAQEIEATILEKSFEGDAMAPQLGPEWVETSHARWQSLPSGLFFHWIRYEKPLALNQGEPALFMDRGPWRAGISHDKGSSRTFVESAMFEHDMRLYIDGDFASEDARTDYAEQLAHFLSTAEDPRKRTL